MTRTFASCSPAHPLQALARDAECGRKLRFACMRPSLTLAVALGWLPVPAAASAAGAGTSLVVTTSVADPARPDACGTSSELDVSPGEQVNLCYRLTNNTQVALAYQTLNDSLFSVDRQPTAPLFSNRAQDVGPGETIQFNRIVTIGADSQTAAVVWNSRDQLPSYAATAVGDADRIFADSFEEAAFQFVDISGSGVVIPFQNHYSLAEVATSFPLTVFDTHYPVPDAFHLCLANNGTIIFTHLVVPATGPGISCAIYKPFSDIMRPLPVELPVFSGNAVDGALFPFLDQLGVDGGVYANVLGSEGDQHLIFQWDKKNYGGDPGGGGITFQVIFNEIDASIDFFYADSTFGGDSAIHDDGASASIGLQSSLGPAVPFSYQSRSLFDGARIHWTPTGLRYDADAAYALHVSKPYIVTSPTSEAGVSATLAPGASTTTALLIDNSGDAELYWHLFSAPAKLHFPEKPARFLGNPMAMPTHSSISAAPSGTNGTEKVFVGPNRLTESPWVPAGDAGIPAPAYLFDPVSTSQIEFVKADGSDPIALDVLSTLEEGYNGFFPRGAFIGSDFSKMYASSPDFSGLTIDTIDTATGVLTQGPLISLPFPPTTMRWDPVSAAMYLVGSVADGGWNQCNSWPAGDDQDRGSSLYTVDVATGLTTFVASLPGVCFTDIAFDRNGLMYGLDFDTGTLYVVDKTTGESQVVGPLDISSPYEQSMDFDRSTDRLYWTAYVDGVSGLYEIDTVSAHVMPVATYASSFSTKYGLTIAKADDSPCTNPGDIPWLHADSTSGTTPPDPGSNSPSLINLTLDASMLATGDYAANLCVYSNDPSNIRVEIPVRLSVR